MGDMMKGLKKTWLRGMEVIGNTASNIADNAKYKVTEMNLETRRREILADFGNVAYEMWQRGESFPPALDAQLKQLYALDEQLTAIRAQRFAAAQEAKLAKEAAEEAAIMRASLEGEPSAEEAAEEGGEDDTSSISQEPPHEELSQKPEEAPPLDAGSSGDQQS